MNRIPHKQAIQLINRRMDGLLNENQSLSLDEHLRSCDSCRVYAAEMDLLPARLQNEFQARWDEKLGPSQKVMEHVMTKARNFPRLQRIFSGVRLLASLAVVVVMIFLVNLVISQLQSTSTAANATETNGTLLASERLLAFASDQNGNYDIYTMRPDGSELTNLTNNPAQDTSPFWSPDGKLIAFISDRHGSFQIYLMDADGSNVIQLTNGEGNYSFDINGFTPWSPDGRKLIFGHKSPEEQGGKLYVIDIYEKTIITLTNEPSAYLLPSWSPNGRHIAFVAFTDGMPYDLLVVGSDGAQLTKLTENLPDGEFYTDDYYWSQDGEILTFLIGGGTYTAAYTATPDGSLTIAHRSDKQILDWWNGITVLEYPEGTLTWLRPDGSESTLDPCPSSQFQIPGTLHKRSDSGNLILASNCSEHDWMFYWANPDGTVIDQLLDSPISIAEDSLFNPTWSLDDRYLAFVGLDTKTLYVLDVAKAQEDPSVQPLKLESSSSPSWQPIVNNDIVEQKPTLAPTQISSLDNLIAFSSTQNGNSDIYTMRADGSGLTNLTNNPAHDNNAIWSPDGKRIAFESDRDGFIQIYLMNADGSNLIQLTNDKVDHGLYLNIDGKYNPWSPDGSKLVYLQTSNGGELSELYVQDINGENKILLARGSSQLISWSPNGKCVGYVLNDSPNTTTFVPDIYVVDSDGSNPRELKKLIPQNEFLDSGYRWSLDGQSIVFISDKNDPAIQVIRPLPQTVYEFDLETNTLLQKGTLKPTVIDWGDEVYLSLDIEKADLSFVWQRADGTESYFDSGDSNCSFDVTRSYQVNFAIGVYCLDSRKFKLYWANADGSTINKLLDWSIVISSFADITWSHDDQYIAFTLDSSLYILNIEDTLKDSSIQPEQVVIAPYTIPSWQPTVNNSIVEQKPTPAVTPLPSPQAADRLIAFTAAIENGNLDIYTMRPDGSGLTNLTNNPAKDVAPFWSPDKKHIAFESDRNGFHQIFLMNADGTGLIPLTGEDGQYEIGVKDGNSFTPWSPDGKKLIISQRSPGEYIWMLYTIDINGGNKSPLVDEPGLYNYPSWSQDGRQVAFVLDDPQTPGGDQIYVVNPDGSNRREITKSLSPNVLLHYYNYYWSRNGQSIFFITQLNSYPDDWTVYEVDLEGMKPVERATSSTRMEDWWEGTSFIAAEDLSTLTWLRSDGTSSTLKPPEICPLSKQSQIKQTEFGWFAKRSSSGKQIINIHCLNDMQFYYANSDGTILKQLLNFPISHTEGFVTNIVWSSDDQFITFNIASPDKTEMYVLNMEEALNNPSTQPLKITISGGELFYSPSWQPSP